MSDLLSQPGEVKFTVEVVRAITGKKEVFEMVGHIVPQEDVKPKTETEE